MGELELSWAVSLFLRVFQLDVAPAAEPVLQVPYLGREIGTTAEACPFRRAFNRAGKNNLLGLIAERVGRDGGLCDTYEDGGVEAFHVV